MNSSNLPTLQIIKIGGKLINEADELARLLKAFSGLPHPKILIHGGGRKATELSKAIGLEVKMVEGRRITDEATLEIAIMVYAGLINKKIVALLQSLGTDAIGLTGADANTILAHKRIVKEIDYGWVGDVDHVNNDSIKALLSAGIVPVFSPITHDGQGQLLNTNADTIASALAIALSKEYHVSLKYCFEYPGVLYSLDNPQNTIKTISEVEFNAMVANGGINEGMIPKLKNGLNALRNGVEEVAICGIDNLLDLENATTLSL